MDLRWGLGCGLAMAVAIASCGGSKGEPNDGGTTTVQQAPDAGSPDAGTPGADAGVVQPDGGTAAADGGSGGTAAADGGSGGTDGGTSAADGGTDGGPVGLTARIDSTDSAGDCTGVVPASAPPAVKATFELSAGQVCRGGTADGDGRVALGWYDPDTRRFHWQAREQDGTVLQDFWAEGLSTLVPQAHGYHGLEVLADGSAVNHKVVDGKGATQQTTGFPSPNTFYVAPRFATIAPVPGGGSIAAVDVASAGTDPATLSSITIVRRFGGDGASGQLSDVYQYGLASMAVTASTAGASFVVWVGGSYLGGEWLFTGGGANWVYFGNRGAGVTRVAVLPLLDGSVAIRASDGWVGRSEAGASSYGAVPDWLAALPADARVVILPRSRGYAILPAPGASGSTCEQRVELRSGSGKVCGAVVFAWSDGGCTTADLTLGEGGTIVQQSPTESCAGGKCTCTHAWWTGILK